ncbi:MAG: precorrin-8X methylmutase [Pseudomonadota bacterium]
MAQLDYIRDPEAIYEQSFAAIESLPELQRLDGAMRPIAIRMVHACGMPDIVSDLRWSDDFQQVGRGALGRGAEVFCDVESLGSTIMKRLLPSGTSIRCDINSSECLALARKENCTRAAAQVDLWGDAINASIVVIGNAPTTLFRILENIDEGGAKPALILGFPVGFVGAAESKAELAANPRGVPYITLMGRRGGTAIAAACMNAVAAGLSR